MMEAIRSKFHPPTFENGEIMKKFFATLAISGIAVLGISGIASATEQPDPTPVVVTEIDPDAGIQAITAELPEGEDFTDNTVFPCDELDASVRGAQVEGQPNFCYLNRSGLARDPLAGEDTISPAETTPIEEVTPALDGVILQDPEGEGEAIMPVMGTVDGNVAEVGESVEEADPITEAVSNNGFRNRVIGGVAAAALLGTALTLFTKNRRHAENI